jgi:SAM-dependent methyltransferase
MNHALSFNKQPDAVLQTEGLPIHCFPVSETGNIDAETVASFGEEWLKFNAFSEKDIKQIGADYFDILPKSLHTPDTVVLDAGCGTGRWASYLAPSVGSVECVDPSDAVYAASRLLKKHSNVRVSRAAIDGLPFTDNSFDLVYSLGVLHHIPDTCGAMEKCVAKVKPGGYFLVYLYYNLDNRGVAFKTLFRLSSVVRAAVSKLPGRVKKWVCDGIAMAVYLPLAQTSKILNRLHFKKAAANLPLSYYGDKSFWIMKNDALDRFGTPLEQRFSKAQIIRMMEHCGLKNIVVSENEPYWHAIGQKI